jgi:hypothetical protein
MQAALTRSGRGHNVIFVIRVINSRRTPCEDHIAFKQKLKAYLEHTEHMLHKAAVDIRLNTAVTPSTRESSAPTSHCRFGSAPRQTTH